MKKIIYSVASILSFLAFLVIWGNLFYIIAQSIPSDAVLGLIIFNIASLGLIILSLYCIHKVHTIVTNIAALSISALSLLSVVIAFIINDDFSYYIKTADFVFAIIYGILNLLILSTFIASFFIEKE